MTKALVVCGWCALCGGGPLLTTGCAEFRRTHFPPRTEPEAVPPQPPAPTPPDPQPSPQPDPGPEPQPPAPKPSPPAEHPVALPVPGRPGFVFSPFNNKVLDVSGLASGMLVADPHYPAAERKYFRVP